MIKLRKGDKIIEQTETHTTIETWCINAYFRRFRCTKKHYKPAAQPIFTKEFIDSLPDGYLLRSPVARKVKVESETFGRVLWFAGENRSMWNKEGRGERYLVWIITDYWTGEIVRHGFTNDIQNVKEL